MLKINESQSEDADTVLCKKITKTSLRMPKIMLKINESQSEDSRDYAKD